MPRFFYLFLIHLFGSRRCIGLLLHHVPVPLAGCWLLLLPLTSVLTLELLLVIGRELLGMLLLLVLVVFVESTLLSHLVVSLHLHALLSRLKRRADHPLLLVLLVLLILLLLLQLHLTVVEVMHLLVDIFESFDSVGEVVVLDLVLIRHLDDLPYVVHFLLDHFVVAVLQDLFFGQLIAGVVLGFEFANASLQTCAIIPDCPFTADLEVLIDDALEVVHFLGLVRFDLIFLRFDVVFALLVVNLVDSVLHRREGRRHVLVAAEALIAECFLGFLVIFAFFLLCEVQVVVFRGLTQL